MPAASHWCLLNKHSSLAEKLLMMHYLLFIFY